MDKVGECSSGYTEIQADCDNNTNHDIFLTQDELEYLYDETFKQYYLIIYKNTFDIINYISPMKTLSTNSNIQCFSRKLLNKISNISIVQDDQSNSLIIGQNANNEHQEYSRKKDLVINDLIFCCKIIYGIAYQYSLISDNEDLDDIPTENLRYLLLPFILSHLYCESPNMSLRFECLEESIRYLKEFMNCVIKFPSIVRNEDRTLYYEMDDESSKESSHLTTNYKKNVSCFTSRNEKIARIKYENELMMKIEFLINKMSKFSNSSTEASFLNGHIDEDVKRELYIQLLKRFSSESLTQLKYSQEEMMLLNNRNNTFYNEKKAQAKNSLPRNIGGEINHHKRGLSYCTINNPGDLRLMFQKMVFTRGYVLPTMSLAECAAREMELEVEIIGNSVSQSKDEGEKDREKEEIKSREWDDWKDENPKGIGNKMRNIG